MKSLLFFVAMALEVSASSGAEASTQAFAKEVERVLPVENPYDYHRQLETAPVHEARRAPDATPEAGEMALPDSGWKLVWQPDGGEILRRAVLDFQDYLRVSMGVSVVREERTSLNGWRSLSRAIVVGTREQLSGCGEKLKGPKDYRLCVTPERVTVCGFDARGAMFGLYNLEARMNLREAPFLKRDLDTVRHSLYDVRMAQSWMGWMEFPDALLSRMAHDGFDAIYASALANPNGDRTAAENSTDFFARILHKIRPQDPARMHDLVRRAAKYGIKVYAPIIYQYMGTPESEEGLRRLVRDVVREFPDIRGYVLLTEGFWYRKWGGQDAGKAYLRDWARNWCKAVGVVAEECHRIDPSIEILPWEYNINFRPENADVKRYFVRQLPPDTVPLLTWENGTGLDFDGFRGWVRDYSISRVGPAECTEAQIDEAHGRNMRAFVNGDTFVCGAQLQTVPYQPFPYQWHERYKAMERHGVNGTMESWSQGYSPNVMTELRSWYCWSDAPEIDELLGAVAAREFGAENRDAVLTAWRLFSEAIRLVPDTGPYMGTGNAVGNPIFFSEPPVRAVTYTHSWSYDPAATAEMDKADGINPYWPFTCARLVFVPDFGNRTNRAENYARFVSGVETMKDRPFLPVFLKYLKLAADKMEEGLVYYRKAALGSPPEKRRTALREVVVAEQLQRMLASDHAILAFEDLRLKWVAERDAQKANALLGRMEAILREEIGRTELSLLAAARDSRLGFQQETDYVYTPYSLREKLDSMRETLERRFAPAPFAAGDRVAVFGPGESPLGPDVPARLQLSWNLDRPGVPVDFFDATYRRDSLKDGFRRWKADVAGVRPTHVLSLFGEVPGTAGFEADVRLLVLKARSEGMRPVFALPPRGAAVVRRVAREEGVPLVDVEALLTKGRADVPKRALASYDGLVEGERTLRVFDDMRFAAEAHGMYLGDDIQDEPPTVDAWIWWLKANGRGRLDEVERWKTLYGREPEWRAKTEACRAALRKATAKWCDQGALQGMDRNER